MKDKNVLITGGTKGLGLSLAEECLRREANVGLISRKTILTDILAKNGVGKVKSYSADVSNINELNKAVDAFLHDFGKLDFVFCCAGLSRQDVIENLEHEKVRQMVDVNLIGTLNTLKLCVPELRKNGCGRACLISSVAGQIGFWGMSSYSATKFALKGIAEALYMEFLDTEIAATIVYPPDMTTPGLEEENKTKPEIVRKISELADEVHPEKIVKGLITAVERGDADFSVGLDGWFCSRINIGLGPASSYLNLLAELLLSNVFRLIALAYRKIIYRIVRNGAKDKACSEF